MVVATQAKILDLIQKKGRGKIFISKDFLDIGSRDAVDQSLSRLARAGKTKRLGRGLYYYPKVNKTLGIELSPDPDEIARALARRTGSRLAPSGAVAANRLGLSTQVPAKHVYLTDGRTRKLSVGSTTVTVKHVAPKDFPPGSPTSAQVFQALRYLGKDAVNDDVISQLKQKLSPTEKKKLLADAKYTTDWITEVVKQVVAQENEEITTHG